MFGSAKKKLLYLREQLEVERGQTLYRGPMAREKVLMADLSEILAREEAMEKQRARVNWLLDGDKNTTFFQAKAKARARMNRIQSLARPDGMRSSEQEVMEQWTAEFYQNLFTAQEQLEPDLVCQNVPRKVLDQMCELLVRPFTEEEVRNALFQMKPRKAPGTDGFTASFFFPETLGAVETECL